MAYGYSALDGFVKKTYAEILDSMKASVRADVAPDLILDDEDPYAQALMLAADEVAEVWEVTQTGSDALNPNNAEGQNLTGVAALTGTPRLGATRSTVLVSCTMLSGAVLAPGTARANVAGKPTVLFRIRESYTAPANETRLLLFEAETLGPVDALAGTLTQIAVPLTGWVSCTNPSDAQRGSDEETDPALRVRRVQDLDRTGSANVIAIREDLDAVIQPLFASGSCTVLENTSHVTVDGMAPHSIECIVYDGVIPVVPDATIAKTLFETKGAGIETNGPILNVVLDRKGEAHEIRFRRATQHAIHFAIEATYDTQILTTPAQVTATQDAIKLALVNVGNVRRVTGLDVTRAPFFGALTAIPGLVDVTRYAHADGAPPGPGESIAPLVIPRREIAIVDSANMVVTLTAAGEL